MLHLKMLFNIFTAQPLQFILLVQLRMDLMKKVTVVQKLDCSYYLELEGNISGEVSPIGCKMELKRKQ